MWEVCKAGATDKKAWNNDARVLGKFDTLQIIDDIKVPYEYGNSGIDLEPLTWCYPEAGWGGYRQLYADSWIHFDEVILLEDCVE